MLRAIDRIVEAACAAIILTIVLVVFGGFVFRYVLIKPLGWAEEVARLGLVWVTFLGAYVAFRRGAHIDIDMVVSRLSAVARQRLGLVTNLLMALVIAVLVREGIRYAKTFFDDPSPYLRFPIGLQYLALPAGGVLWLLALFVRSRGLLKPEKPGAQAADAGRPDSE